MTVLDGQSDHLTTLIRARRLLSDEARWAKGAWAKDAAGRPVHPGHHTATSWNIEGAVGICDNASGLIPVPLLYLLDEATRSLFPVTISHINQETGEEEDPSWTYFAYESAGFVNDMLTHGQLLKILDLAIELVRKS